MVGWQKIDEAPKEKGQKLLGCWQYFYTKAGHKMGGEVFVMEWLAGDETGESSFYDGKWVGEQRGIKFPTHFQFIDELPTMLWEDRLETTQPKKVGV